MLDKSYKPCTQLIKDQFYPQLKIVPFRDPKEGSDGDIDEIFKYLNLEKSITPYDCIDDLRKWPKLNQYLAHCYHQRTFLFSKKCGSQNYDQVKD